MPVQQYIKHAYEHEEASIREIAQRVGVSWRTAKKYAEQDDWNLPAPKRRRQPVMEPYAELVDTWLLEDRLLKRKLRRSAAQIYRDLKKPEHGFTGSERTVREYVSRRKRELLGEGQTPYVELAHPPGAAQADFGTAQVVRDGQFEEVQVLTLSFPFSNAGMDYPLPSQNGECFMEGLGRLFERIGGVPQRLRLDNLSAAVVSIGPGESRVLTEAFQRFALHHGFEVEFCGPARGNEKGHVENKVGYTRRQWLNPPPELVSYADLADRLWEKAEADMQRPHYKKDQQIADLWIEEKAALHPLPDIPFEVTRLDRAKLNNYGQFRWEKSVYEVPQGHPGMPVLLKIFWDRIEVRDDRQQLLTTLERAYMPKRAEIDWAAHFEIYARRPRAVTSAARFVHLPEVVQRFFKATSSDERARRVRFLRDVLKRHPMDRFAEALDVLPEARWSDRAAVEQTLYTLDPERATPSPLTEAHTPPEVADYTPQTAAYDRLLPVSNVEVPA